MRRGARVLAGTSGLVVAQLGFLKATYTTPLDAAGPTSGVCQPATAAAARRRFSSAGAAQGRECSAEEVRQRRWLPWAPREAATPGRSLRVLVLGDSLVSGVGGLPHLSPGLPASFGAALAERLAATVTWKAAGLTGADVAEIRAALLPQLRRDVAAHETPPACVVLLCGLNDFKHAHVATTAAFRQALRDLCADIRALVGPQTLLVLPALPIEGAARFPAPLRWLVSAQASRFDAQKRLLAEGPDSNCLFVAPPAVPTSWAEAVRLLSADGVHPNCEGYRLWAEHIADAVSCRLQGTLARA